MRIHGARKVAAVSISLFLLLLGGMAGAFLLVKRWYRTILHPEPTPVHRERMQAQIDELSIKGLRVKEVRYVDTDLPGMCAEIEVTGQKSPSDALRRIRTARHLKVNNQALLQISEGHDGYSFFERAGRLDGCVSGYGYDERLRFEYLVADSEATGRSQ